MSPRSLPEICVVWNLLSKVVTELTFCSWQGSRCISWSVHWEWLRTVCLGLFSCADFELSLSRSLIIIHYSILVLETWDVLDSSGVDGVCVWANCFGVSGEPLPSSRCSVLKKGVMLRISACALKSSCCRLSANFCNLIYLYWWHIQPIGKGSIGSHNNDSLPLASSWYNTSTW